jgi:hypothetical protein
MHYEIRRASAKRFLQCLRCRAAFMRAELQGFDIRSLPYVQ